MRPVRDQRGFSVLEMLVAVTILLVAMTITAGLLLQSSRMNSSQQLTAAAQSDVRTCLSIIESRLRTAGWDPTSAGIQPLRAR